MANTENIKHLKSKGKMDYDYTEDILFFKVKGREYDYSLEFQNMVIDIDKEKFIIGIQIFNASEFLGIPKLNLREIPKWEFNAEINKESIEIRLKYEIQIRNRIYEKTPIIIQENHSNLPQTKMVCSI